MESVRRTASQSVTMFKAAAGMATTRPLHSLPEPANEATPAPAYAEPTVLSAKAEFKGAIVTAGSIEIRGRVEGDVRAAAITVCAGATVKGDIAADVILIQGAVEGRVEAQDVRLQAGANVVGEIVHGSLGIDTTATFEGTIKRIPPAAG
ncbi:MAG: polymer-forming cytoskeletal protein [Hyphomonadaceae bacterium]